MTARSCWRNAVSDSRKAVIHHRLSLNPSPKPEIRAGRPTAVWPDTRRGLRIEEAISCLRTSSLESPLALVISNLVFRKAGSEGSSASATRPRSCKASEVGFSVPQALQTATVVAVQSRIIIPCTAFSNSVTSHRVWTSRTCQ